MTPDFLTAEEIGLQMFCWEILREKIERKYQKEVIHTSALKDRRESGCRNKHRSGHFLMSRMPDSKLDHKDRKMQ